MSKARPFTGLMITASLVVVEPVVVPQQAAAASLFEKLFPRAAERRRAREARRLQRIKVLERSRQDALARERARSAPRVAAPRYKRPKMAPYAATTLKAVPVANLLTQLGDQQAAAQEARKIEIKALVERGLVQDRLSLDQAVGLTAAVADVPTLAFAAAASGLEQFELRAHSDHSKAVIDHYATAGTFLWVGEDGQPTPQARALADVLETAEQYGLNAQHYAVRFPITVNASTNQDDAELARFDLELSLAALRYAIDAKHGLVKAGRLSRFHDFKQNKPQPVETFAALTEASDPAAYLLASHPAEPAFEVLRQEMIELSEEVRRSKAVSIKAGTFLKPGGTSDQLPAIVEAISRKFSTELRQKHADVISSDHSEGLYSEAVVAMVKDFQKSQKLSRDGIIGRNTLGRLKTANPKSRLNKVKLAMERLRWHPDRFGDAHVFINQPAYRASYMRNGKTELSMKVIVGKQANQTNFFHDEIEYVEFNPYWGVPRSILVNQMLPRLRSNPGYLDAKGWEVTTGSGRRVSSSSINWSNVGANFPYNVRQPPGRRNALGELKIMFPNKHAIYMHDTPAKNLFSRRTRTFSHGCVRLEDPRAMAAAVLGTSVGSVAKSISTGKNRKRSLKTKLPVYVSYFTAWPDDSGKIRYYSDMYGRDTGLLKALEREDAARQKAGRA